MKKLESQLQYEVTCQKLSELEKLRDQSQARDSDNPYVKSLTLRSLNRLIKQLREEMIWYEYHTGIRQSSTPAVTMMSSPGDTSTP
jgi:hypothetical protein